MNSDRAITMDEFKGIPAKLDLVKMREDIERFRGFAAILKEHVKIAAGITKAKYDALVLEGFTPAQAIELCKGAL